jgi:hypothetical protein
LDAIVGSGPAQPAARSGDGKSSGRSLEAVRVYSGTPLAGGYQGGGNGKGRADCVRREGRHRDGAHAPAAGSILAVRRMTRRRRVVRRLRLEKPADVEDWA